MAAFELLNERAILVRDLPGGSILPSLEALRSRLPGLLDAVQAFETAALYFQDEIPSPESIEFALTSLVSEGREFGVHEIPICFELGDDLSNSAESLAMAPPDLTAAFLEGVYTVEAIGFSPGFPYLSGLPKAMCGLPRLPSPRPRVEPGSIGIAEKNACIYPSATPGGWNLIARTPIQIVDVNRGHFPIRVGDTVVFRAISKTEFESMKGTLL